MAGGREVVLRFVSDTTGLKKGLSEAGKHAQETEGVFAKMSGKISGLGQAASGMALGIAGVTTSVIGFASAGLHRLGEEQVAAAQTGAVIMSTGGAAQVTAGHVHEMADSLAKLSGVDDEVVQGGENLLLTFTNIKNGVGAGNDIFDQATKAALDMSVALGDDLSSSSIRLGKALQDPILGVTALRRVGVMFTDEQKNAIASMVATGDTMGAQKVVLAELTREFGGSAEAYGKTIPGAIGRARTAVENFSADVAKKALPAVQSFGQSAADVAKAIGPTLIGALSKVGGVMVAVGKFASDHKGIVIALAAVYVASLIPALYSTAVAFAAAGFAQIASTISLAITSVRVLALEMGTLKLALVSTGIGAFVVLVAAVAQGMISAGQHAEKFVKKLSEGLDLTTYEGLQTQQERLKSALGENDEAWDKYGGTVKRNLQGLAELATPLGNGVLENVQQYKKLTAEQEKNAAALVHWDENVQTVANHLKITRVEVERIARAAGVDLTGGLELTTGALEAAAEAEAAAASGWGVYKESAEDAIATQKELVKAFETAIDPVKVYSTALTAADTATKASNKAAATAITDHAKALRDGIDARHDAEKAALNSETVTGKASKKSHDQRVKDLDGRQKAENDAADATVTAEGKKADAVEAAAVKSTLSMEAYRKLIEKNTKDTLSWMNNLAVIASRGGGDFVDVLAGLGPDAAGMVAEIATSSKPKFEQFAGTMRAGSKTAVDTAKAELGKLPDALNVIGALGGQTLADSLRTALQANKITPADILSKEVIALLGSGKSYSDLVGMGIVAGPAVPTGPAPHKAPFTDPAGVVHHYAEGHFAQVAPAGAWRVWAEPETGGEAYIPLAMSKRAGSMALVAQVANQFGARLVPMAAGGTWGVPAYTADRSAAAAGMSSGDMSRLIGALEKNAKLRPTQMQNVFPPGIDPVHVAQKIAWRLRP